MSFNYIMNSKLLYFLVILGILSILLFCLITLKRSYKYAIKLGMNKKILKSVILSSALFSIVPSISILIGLFGLVSVIGVPWSWFRLSVVGSVTYELMAADLVATNSGYGSISALNASGDSRTIGTIMFVMSICILGSVLGVLFFGKRIQNGVSKTCKKQGKLGVLIVNVLPLAIVEVFLPLQIMNGIVSAAVVVTAFFVSLIHMVIIKRFKVQWLKNFILADSLLLGMVSSLIWIKVF